MKFWFWLCIFATVAFAEIALARVISTAQDPDECLHTPEFITGTESVDNSVPGTTSCWSAVKSWRDESDQPPHENPISFVAFSPTTLSALIELLLSRPTSGTTGSEPSSVERRIDVLRGVLKSIRDGNELGVVFVIDRGKLRQGKIRNENTYCNFYPRIHYGEANDNLVIKGFSKMDCQKGVNDIITSGSKLFTSSKSDVFDTFDKFYFARFREENSGDINPKKFARGKIDFSVFSHVRHGGLNPKEDWDPKFESVTVPGLIYTTKAGDSLKEISREIFGSDRDWRILWVNNADKVSDPNNLPGGLPLEIPAWPKGSSSWQEWADNTSPKKVANEMYKNSKYDGFVQILIDRQKKYGFPDKGTFIVPEIDSKSISGIGGTDELMPIVFEILKRE